MEHILCSLSLFLQQYASSPARCEFDVKGVCGLYHLLGGFVAFALRPIIRVSAVLNDHRIKIACPEKRERNSQFARIFVGRCTDQPGTVFSLPRHDNVFADHAAERLALLPGHLLRSNELQDLGVLPVILRNVRDNRCAGKHDERPGTFAGEC